VTGAFVAWAMAQESIVSRGRRIDHGARFSTTPSESLAICNERGKSGKNRRVFVVPVSCAAD